MDAPYVRLMCYDHVAAVKCLSPSCFTTYIDGSLPGEWNQSDEGACTNPPIVRQATAGHSLFEEGAGRVTSLSIQEKLETRLIDTEKVQMLFGESARYQF